VAPLNLYTPARFESACGEAFYTSDDMEDHALLCEACGDNLNELATD
jgi:hypothetical protein